MSPGTTPRHDRAAFIAAIRRDEPTSYLVAAGPLGDVMRDMRGRLPAGAAIGVVGLGVGTIAAYERPSDSMTYFEIDRAIVDLARDPRYFTYLRDAPAPPRIVMGDGRLLLAAAAAGSRPSPRGGSSSGVPVTWPASTRRGGPTRTPDLC